MYNIPAFYQQKLNKISAQTTTSSMLQHLETVTVKPIQANKYNPSQPVDWLYLQIGYQYKYITG